MSVVRRSLCDMSAFEKPQKADQEQTAQEQTGQAKTDSEPDSFDEHAEDVFKEFVGDATPTDGPAPAG